MSYRPKAMLPVVEWLKTGGRFQHLFRDEHQVVLDRIQREVDERCERLIKLCGEG